MALPASYKLTNGAIQFNLDNYLAYFKLNDRPINFQLNAVTLPSGEFRLLEDEFMRLLENGDFRLLE
jgi:hypothetical protein